MLFHVQSRDFSVYVAAEDGRSAKAAVVEAMSNLGIAAVEPVSVAQLNDRSQCCDKTAVDLADFVAARSPQPVAEVVPPAEKSNFVAKAPVPAAVMTEEPKLTPVDPEAQVPSKVNDDGSTTDVEQTPSLVTEQPASEDSEKSNFVAETTKTDGDKEPQPNPFQNTPRGY